MKLRDLSPDRELRDLLARFDAPARPTATERRALERRIETLAAPVLAVREGNAPAWWEFAADWARMLVPLGIVTALAAAMLMLWATHADHVRSAIIPVVGQDSLIGSTTHDRTSQRLLDYLVAPVSRTVPTSPRNPE